MTDDSTWDRVRALFDAALRVAEEEREAFLRNECGNDNDLFQEVWRLVSAAGGNDADIEQIVRTAAEQVADSEESLLLDQRIGNYKLVQLIASGGMGNVYLAERVDDQFDHEVAIKILQAARIDSLFVQRFRSERQVLASLDHRNICKLLDGGETADGSPYLVMEYVRGEPIDDYCDRRCFDLKTRLKLFQKVCLAVDYAHRNLVVHRDIKPSNILVSEDGEPKLLDFGIARMIDSTGISRAAMTVESNRMLTPEYASPEQVRGEPVATATDIYSLGVLLYRLLCGRGPYRVRSDLPSDLARAILEDEPSKPSTVLVTAATTEDSGEADIGASRHTTLARLRTRLQGDLDNIALKALRKEPERRYVSARAFQDDIDNYLTHRPVSARPASISYRAAKFVRRQRGALSVSGLIVLVLMVSVYQVVGQRNKAERAAIQSEHVTGFLSQLFSSASPETSHGDEISATDLLAQGVRDIEQLNDQPLVQARLLMIMGQSYKWMGLNSEASSLLGRAVELRRRHAPNEVAELANALNHQADNERILYNLDEALQLFQESLELFRQAFGEEHPAVANAYNRLGDVYRMQVRMPKARASLEAAVAIKEALGQIDDSVGIDTRGNLALVYDESGLTDEAINAQAAVVAASRRVDGDRHPNTIIRITNLSLMQTKLGLYDVALDNNSEAYAYAENEWKSDLRTRAWVTRNRAEVLRYLGRFDEAEALHQKAVELQRQHSGTETGRYAGTLRSLGKHYVDVAEFTSARAALEQAIAAATAAGENSGREVGRSLIQRARLSNAMGNFEQAASYAELALEQSEHIGQLSVQAARRELAVSLSGLGRVEAASHAFASLIDELESIDDRDIMRMLSFLLAATRHHREHGELDTAIAYAERANSLSLSIQPQDSWPAALVRAEYGLTLWAAGDRPAALPLLENVQGVLQPLLGASDTRVQPVTALLESQTQN